nr:lipoprotein LpqH [Mycobacterium malmoense]
MGVPVRDRIAAIAAAAFAVTLLGACASRPPSQISSTASVTVDGKDRNFHIVKCGQLEWTRMIDIGGDFAGARVVIDESAQPAKAESVHIQNVGGFTGMYSRGDGGNADMSMTGDKFTISGTANGYKTDKPNEPATATFKIVIAC